MGTLDWICTFFPRFKIWDCILDWNYTFFHVSGHSATTTTTATTTLEDTTTPETEITTSTEYIPRGCVSKRSECTQNVNDCRTFTHRSVAQVFCRCSSICIEVASNPDNDFNMQCHASASSSLTKKEPRSLKPTSDTPFYCQFIPMLSYNWWREKLFVFFKTQKKTHQKKMKKTTIFSRKVNVHY